ADELWTADWTGNYGLVTPVSLLALPVDVSLAVFRGDSLAREADGKLLVSAFGFTGEGVFRIDPSVAPPTYQQVSPILATDRFTDLSVEADGTILGVGQRISTGEVGVFRVEPSGPSMGNTTTLSADPAWTSPVAVAVAANGDIFVADEGTCSQGVCTGAEVVRVDPSSGARLDVWSGGSITGPVDLAVVPAVPACADGLDNDFDSLVDFGTETACTAWWDVSEQPDCSDGVDNDGDGAIDYPADAGCKNANAQRENPECSDGLDNDGDGFTDLADSQCGLESGPQELQPRRSCGLLGAEALPLLAGLARRRRRRARAA
ncbi:MAG TPA: hypothetical protein VKB65_12980, partial [Myxococcota bacterium]|nr:hypothetical protein [Myxococcota bacterium]